MSCAKLLQDNHVNDVRAAVNEVPPNASGMGGDFCCGRQLWKSFNVLVVDDEPLVLRTLSRVLKKHADQVFVAESAEEAERILAAQAIQFVVCDYNLGAQAAPGTEVVEGMRRNYPSIVRAVIFTGEEPRSISFKSAAVAVLRKSYDVGVLCDMVERTARHGL